jgi:Tol biopolymer transport system component/tRNA A-37 threonylcarbamoyl transferase component Bud32
MPLTVGLRLGPYEILAPLGAGGMGEVYKARDTRLNRFVAIKVLPAERVADESRKQRFIQEAQAASALNHPNIITVHDIAIDNGRDYLVMEYVPGKTLDALIPRTGMRLGELLKIAIQVAEGLSAAHGAGIIHRDLKPSNVMVSENGLVKILDFGLAKLTERSGVTEDNATVTLSPKTEAGMVMGTAAYMSPEQAEGKLLDARSDIFSFGAVLYEMATGRRAFKGDSQAATVAAVLTREPTPLGEVAPALPLELERIIMRCLRKDPARRQQHMTDVKVLLEDLKEESKSGKLAPAGAPKTSRWRWPWVAAAAAVLIMAAGASLWLGRDRDKQPPRVVPLTTFAGSENYPSFSPDGNQVVFCWNGEKQDNWDLYVKMIGSATVLRLTTDAADDLFPAWSPDGRQIAFLKYGQRPGIYLISPLGGPEQKLADFDAAPGSPAWSPDGKFLVVAKSYREEKPEAGGGALFLIPVQGGGPRPILVPAPGRWYQYPEFAPAGRLLAFASCEGPAYGRYCDLLRVELNGALQPQGRPRQAAAVSATISGLAWTADGHALIYSAGNLSTGLYLWRVDAAGGAEPKRFEIASQGALFPAVALKESRLAFSHWMDDQDIWRLEVGGKPQPFLVSSMLDASPQFSPDGRRIAFASGRGVDRIAIWLSNADGAGLVQLTRGPENYHGSPRWSPDGHWIVFDARGKEGRWNIKVVESSGGQAQQLTSGPFTSTVPSWSGDGKWIYFASDRTGRFEIWRVPAQGGPAGQITRDGGYLAFESRDAKTLYYTKTGDPGGGPLYARPLGGSEERQVVGRVVGRGFAVFEDGIYYLDSRGPGKYEIRFHEFASSRSRTVSPIEGQLGLGFSVSPDRKTFLFTWLASPGSDLMLIENFR